MRSFRTTLTVLASAAALAVVPTLSSGAATQPTAAQPAAATPAAQLTGASCGTTTNTEYATGTTAAAIGWAGNQQAVVACLTGSFVVINNQQTYGYGVYDGSRTTWVNAGGYLPALVTGFHHGGAAVTITNFGDKVTIGGHPYVVIYSRVSVTNPTGKALTVDPQPTSNLTALGSASTTVPAHRTVNHDYAAVSDEFGGSYAAPTAAQLRAAGGYAQHYAHMRSFWNGQLSHLVQIRKLPDMRLADAYRTGFIYTQITRAGADLKTGVNGYDKEYSHDVIGILANMLTQGFRSDGTTSALDLLLQARDVVGTQAQYDDGIWKYSWPWAIYLQKTGDLTSVQGQLRHPRARRGRPAAEHQGQRARDRGGPHRPRRDHREHAGHRRQRLLDDRRLLRAHGAGVVQAGWPSRSATPPRPPGPTTSTTACSAP